jgi:hypothetical protein
MQNRETEGTRSDRIELFATPEEKALLLRAAEIAHLDMNSFVMRAAGRAAQEVFEKASTLEDWDALPILPKQVELATSDEPENTGKDLIAFFRNSPLADVAIEFERDKATSRTITF